MMISMMDIDGQGRSVRDTITTCVIIIVNIKVNRYKNVTEVVSKVQGRCRRRCKYFSVSKIEDEFYQLNT